MISAGVDMIEIGIPFSDPIADGPIIQEASFVALSNGMTPNKSLQIVKDIRSKFSDIPIILMTYSNILVKAGMGDLVRKAGQSGADGFILQICQLKNLAIMLMRQHSGTLQQYFWHLLIQRKEDC